MAHCMKPARCEGTSAESPTALFGRRLRKWLRRAGLPLKRVAHDLGVSLSVVSEWERALRFPCCRHLDMLARYTGIPLCAFFRVERVECPFLREFGE
jgi:transcriptional regulator with XRE-family HTH domain